MPSTPPSETAMNPRTRALKNGVPVLAQLTPRTKRQQVLAEKAEAKRELNRIRQEAAAAKRKTSTVGWNGKPKYGTSCEPVDGDRENQASQANFPRVPQRGKGSDEPNWRARPAPDAANHDSILASKPKARRSSRLQKQGSIDDLTSITNQSPISCTSEEKEQGNLSNAKEQEYVEKVHELSKKLEQVENQIEVLTTELDVAKNQVEESQADYETLDNTMNAEIQKLETKLADAKTESQVSLRLKEEKLCEIESKLKDEQERLVLSQSRVEVLEKELESSKEDQQQLQQELEQERKLYQDLKSSAAEAERQFKEEKAKDDSAISRLETNNGMLQSEIEQLNAKIAELEERSLHDAKIRRDLHNQVQELRGNIRVYARVRPILPSDGEEEDAKTPIDTPPQDIDQRSLIVTGEAQKSVDGRSSHAKSWNFSFDKSFRPWQTQADVFEEVGHLVQSAIDGYRVSIMAYGQTGSGKTYTMEGSGWNRDEHSGVIPRSVDHIFNSLEEEAQDGWEFQVHASFLEIYNEEIRDLIQPNDEDQLANQLADVQLTSNKSGVKRQSSKLYEIRHTQNGDTIVNGLNKVQVHCAEDVRSVMQAASKLRSVASTECNDRSSRSHSVFQLYITATHQERGEERRGLLNLVDLAGSERLKSSKAEGVHLKETQAINKSLSCLGDVIFSLGNGAKHVPYRNSKLTYLLQNSLGGNSKTLMFVNVSPTTSSLGESLCSLRFGQKVNSCEIGTATRNTIHKK